MSNKYKKIITDSKFSMEQRKAFYKKISCKGLPKQIHFCIDTLYPWKARSQATAYPK